MVEKNFSLKVLPMEHVKPATSYSFTLNISGNPTGYNADRQRYVDFLNTYFDHTYFAVYPEYSPRGRLHYHGTLSFPNHVIIGVFYSRLHHILKKCQIEIDTINDEEKWIIYCKKQKYIMKPLSDHKQLTYRINTSLCYDECTKTKLATFGDILDSEYLDE